MLGKRRRWKFIFLTTLVLLSILSTHYVNKFQTHSQDDVHGRNNSLRIPSLVVISSEIFAVGTFQFPVNNIVTIDLHIEEAGAPASNTKESFDVNKEGRDAILLIEFDLATQKLHQYSLDVQEYNRFAVEIKNLVSIIQFLASIAVKVQASEMTVNTPNLILNLQMDEDGQLKCIISQRREVPELNHLTPSLDSSQQAETIRMTQSKDGDATATITPRQLLKFDNMLHPVKILILSALAQKHKIQLSMLREQLQISWGKLKHHVAYLEKGGYISSGLEFVDGSPRVLLFLEEKGYQTFRDLSRALRDALA